MLPAMNINNEEQAREAIALWSADPVAAQIKKLRLALESLELGEMYYAQKGNELGQARLAACQLIICARLGEIQGE